MANTRADQIFEAFKRFHVANPAIWELFERYTMELVRAGRASYSANAVMERIRWHLDVETTGSPVKLNNNFTAYYARLFAAMHFQHAGFFSYRKRISSTEPAQPNDVQVFDNGPPGDELELFAALRELA